MAISISSNVTLLNSDGVSAAGAIARQGTAQEIIAAAQKEAASPTSSNFSSVSLISSSGKSRLTLESLQAQAGALQNANVPPTLSDFKVAVQGVVSSLNALGTTLANSLAEFGSGRSFVARAKEFVDSIVPAKKIGIESQGNGGFAINQKQLIKAFNEDGKGAFAALQEFAAMFVQARDVPPAEKPKQTDDTEKSKEAMRRADAAARNREADRVQQNQAQQNQVPQADVPKQDFQAQLGVQLDSASGFTAQTAVTSYLTVAAL
ncbi:MAG: hypothetical protein K8Q92_06000 [Methylophilales bacterium]|nr:hypothetical protein [Methylophilales bacterium]